MKNTTRKIKQHSIKYNFLMNFILSASQFIFPLITFPYVSRVLLADGNGKITFAASVANYFIMVASLGIPTYGIRACAQVRDDKEKLSKTVQELLIINTITTAITTTIYVICIFLVDRFHEDKTLFWVNGIGLVLNMVGLNWLYQALEQYDFITVRSLAFKALSIILMLVFVRQQSDYVIYGVITVFAAVGSNLLNLFVAHRYVDFRWRGKYNLRKHLKPIFVLFAQSLAVSIYTNLDTVMLGFMKTDADVGYYNASVKVKTILVSLVTSLGNVLLPRMAYYAKEHKEKEFTHTMTLALNFTALISIPLALYFSMFSAESIQFLAGNGYSGAVLPMRIITISTIAIGFTAVLGVQVLTAIEKERYVLYSVIVGAMMDFLLNLIFIPHMGAAGAALATLIAEFAVLAMEIFYTRDFLIGIVGDLRVHIYLLMTIIAAAVAGLTKLLSISSVFLTLAISSFAFFGVYGIQLLIVKDELLIKGLSGIVQKVKKSKTNQ